MDGKCKKCRVNFANKQTSAVKLVFFTVLQLVIKRFSSVIMVDPKLLLDSLPTEIAHQLRRLGIATIQDIFKEDGPLDQALNWCHFEVLVTIVDKFGDQKCKQELNGYTSILEKYLRGRSRVVSGKIDQDTHPPAALSPAASCCTELVVDAEWEGKMLQNESIKGYIASLLGTTPNHLHFSHSQ